MPMHSKLGLWDDGIIQVAVHNTTVLQTPGTPVKEPGNAWRYMLEQGKYGGMKSDIHGENANASAIQDKR
jgi:hypothetical protein